MNTLKVAKQLIEAGFDAKKAEILSLTINEAVDEKAATKLDLLEVKSELRLEILNIKTDLQKQIRSSMYITISVIVTFLGIIPNWSQIVAWFK